MSTILPFGFYDLIETFPEPGCAVCNLLLHDTHQYMDALLYEFVNTPETHRKFRDGRGFCHSHSWQLQQYGSSVVGISILYEAALDEILNILTARPAENGSALAWLRGSKNGLADKLDPIGPCPVCKAMDEAEKRYTDTLSRYISDERLAAAYRTSSGLCLPHFRHTLRAAKDSSSAEQIALIQTGIWRGLKNDLGEFVRKNLYQNADEPITSDEGNSWRRAIAALCGQETIVDFARRASS